MISPHKVGYLPTYLARYMHVVAEVPLCCATYLTSKMTTAAPR